MLENVCPTIFLIIDPAPFAISLQTSISSLLSRELSLFPNTLSSFISSESRLGYASSLCLIDVSTNSVFCQLLMMFWFSLLQLLYCDFQIPSLSDLINTLRSFTHLRTHFNKFLGSARDSACLGGRGLGEALGSLCCSCPSVWRSC